MQQLKKQEKNYNWMVSYQWTDIPEGVRKSNMAHIVNFFEKKKESLFCSDQFQNFIEDKNWTPQENYDFCLVAQNKVKNILFFINSPLLSKGLLLELDLAIKSKQKTHLLVNKKFLDTEITERVQRIVEKNNGKVFVFEGKFEDYDMENISSLFDNF